MRAYTSAARPSATHPTLTAARKRPGEFGIAAIIALVCVAQVLAADPPADVTKRVAQRETQTAEERSHYAYGQFVRVQEMDTRGAQAGEYQETREVIFSPSGERTEHMVGQPVSRLKSLSLTVEDFEDIRTIQPFVLTSDQIWNYDSDFKGEEDVDGVACWLLRIRPKHILSGQRLFDGFLWVRQDDYSVMKSEGRAVPQILTTKRENLFPRFTTVRRAVNGFWFPAVTTADDLLFFRNGSIREKLTIRFNDYRRFGAETTVIFEK